MRPLSSAFSSRGRSRTPISEWSIERILALPHTRAIMAQLATLDISLRETAHAAALKAMLADAQERDMLAADLPTGCWCYGRGGQHEAGLLLPSEDVPLVLSVYCECAVGQARRIADDELRARARAFEQEVRLAGIWEGARVPERFAHCSFDTFPFSPKTASSVTQLRAWLELPEWAIVLYGPYGVGKTGLAISALREAAERHHAGLFVKTPDLLARIRETYRRNSDTSEADVLGSLRDVEFLVMDDIGAEHSTDWATAMLFQVLDDRHDHQRKTIITTNLDLTDLAMHMGERTFHRFEEDTLFVRIDGPNLRNRQ